MLTPLIAQGFGKLSQGTFGRSVGRDGETTLEGEEGAEVNDFSLSPRNHVAPGGLRKEPNGLEIDVQNLQNKVSIRVDK